MGTASHPTQRPLPIDTEQQSPITPEAQHEGDWLGDLARLHERLPQPLVAVFWNDARDGVWRGVLPMLSLFAEDDTFEAAREKLAQMVATYCLDAVQMGLVDEMIPRPLPRREWWSLSLYFAWLRFRTTLARWIHPLHPDGNGLVRREYLPRAL